MQKEKKTILIQFTIENKNIIIIIIILLSLKDLFIKNIIIRIRFQ